MNRVNKIGLTAGFLLLAGLFAKAQTQGRIDLRPYCPLPADQGILPASAAYALCHALAIQRAMQQGSGQPAELYYSASWIFDSLKGGKNCEAGIRLSDAFRFLEKVGVCPAALYPNARYRCQPVPEKLKIPAKSLHRIEGIERLFGAKETTAAAKIAAVRQFLGDAPQPRPVVVVLAIQLGFDALASASGDWQLAPLALVKNPLYEAMVVVGYDDEERVFTLMGSYGTDWGDGGFAKISYESFAQVVKYALVLEAGRFEF